MVRVLLPLENDALFDKKQVLLTERCLSRVYDIADNEEQDDDELLNSMLRTSRILHLSETEIYFLENGDDGPTSPLNEIRAVSSLCEFLSKASAQFSQRRKRTRRELDGPVTSRACSSGNEECSCSGAVEASELIMSRNGGASRAFDILERLRIRLQDLLNGLGEAQMSALSSEVGVACKNWREVKLQEWATRQGVISKIHAAEYRSTGRGAAGRVDIEAGCVILEVPRSLLIYSDTVLHSELGQVFRMLESPFLDENDKAILWTIHERYNPDSFFEPFFAALPQTFCTGLSISEESLTLLDNTFLLAEIMQARELVRKRYNRLFPVLSATFAEVFPQDLFTWENFLWAAELWYLHEIKVHFPDGQVKACLIPVGSLFNHSSVPHINPSIKLDPSTESVKFLAARRCFAGHQCFLSYGTLSSLDTFLFYGFVSKEDNPYDTVTIELALPEDRLTGLREVLLRDYGLGLLHMIGPKPRIPSKLMSVLRIIAIEDSETEMFMERTVTDMVTLKNEVCALNMLIGIVDVHLQPLLKEPELPSAELRMRGGQTTVIEEDYDSADRISETGVAAIKMLKEKHRRLLQACKECCSRALEDLLGNGAGTE